MNKNTENLIWALCIFIMGIVIGYNIKKCPKIENTVVIRDTVYESYPIIDTVFISKPISKLVFRDIIKQVLIVNKDTIYVNYPNWISNDTLHYNGIHVAISDIGNCNELVNRKSLFYGELQDRTITNEITNNISIPPPFISIYTGVSSSFSNRWKAFDLGPALSISIRQKHNISYSYGLNTSTHNLSLQTKIK